MISAHIPLIGCSERWAWWNINFFDSNSTKKELTLWLTLMAELGVSDSLESGITPFLLKLDLNNMS